MIRRPIIAAIGPAVGIWLGHIIYRFINPHLFDNSLQTLLKQSVFYLIAGYCVCLIALIIIKGRDDRKRNSED